MNRILDGPAHSPFARPADMPTKTRTIPLLSSSIPLADPSPQSQGDPMDISREASVPAAANAQSSPETEQSQASNANGASMNATGSQNAALGHPTGAAAAAQQPKVVQTAFIHKLYSMLQDPSIQHLISWSSSNESFVMSPSSDFSKVLAQYFKHTNISSFVRQLNMYGFHKVSDVFHTGSPDSPMWEFKHGNGNFRKGDVAGLREIKRRASRHTLINRDSFSGHKPSVSQPSTPAEHLQEMPDAKLQHMEHSLYDIHSRLARMEESNSMLGSKCQALTDSLVRCHQWTNSMAHFIMSLVPDPDNALHREVANMQREVVRQLDVVRGLESSGDHLLGGRPPYVPTMSVDTGPPLSPRQVPRDRDDSRRPSIIRPPVPAHISESPLRYGSVGTANSTPSYQRPPVAIPPGPHPLSSVSSPPGPNLARRHTSADIRLHGWPTSGSPHFAPSSSSLWPPSPHRSHNATGGDQLVQDVLAQYQMGQRRRPEIPRHPTPPFASEPAPPPSQDNVVSLGVPKFHRPTDSSLPATRRSSMASNVHSLLNPSDTVERADEEGAAIGEDRKRKRLQ